MGKSFTNELIPLFRQFHDSIDKVVDETALITVLPTRFKLENGNAREIQEAFDGSTPIPINTIQLDSERGLINLSSEPTSIITVSYSYTKYPDEKIKTMIIQGLSIVNNDLTTDYQQDIIDNDLIIPDIDAKHLPFIIMQGIINLLTSSLGQISRFQRASVSITRDNLEIKQYKEIYQLGIQEINRITSSPALADGEFQTFINELINPPSIQVYPAIYGSFWSRWSSFELSPYMTRFMNTYSEVGW